MAVRDGGGLTKWEYGRHRETVGFLKGILLCFVYLVVLFVIDLLFLS